MAQSLARQIDVGNLTIQGLSQFSSMLATLSADNVVPTAMVQMENLGNLFPINGDYAAKVPDLLQRCPSVRLDRLGLAVGWRRGDAASLMATSAGGQAVSLLSFCLCNLYTPQNVGSVLMELSQKCLSKDFTISSIAQLVDVAKLLSCKLEALGFGNMLASQLVRIHNAYELLSKEFPANFLETLTIESMVDLFHALSRALLEETSLVRISGTRGMGHILAIILVMFPQDAVVTVDNIVIHEGLRRSILLEIAKSDSVDTSDGLLNIHLESVLDTSGPLILQMIQREPFPYAGGVQIYCFQWSGWIAQHLELTFFDAGLKCTQKILEACCDLLVPLASAIPTHNDMAGDGLTSLLGPQPFQRIREVCLLVFRASPSPGKNLVTAYSEFITAFREVVPTTLCSCRQNNRCDLSKGWIETNRIVSKQSCLHHRTWTAVGGALTYGLFSFFINAAPNSTFQKQLSRSGWHHHYASTVINSCIHGGNAGVLGTDGLRRLVMRLCHGSDASLINGSLSSTVYPSTLRELQIDPDLRVSYELAEGRLVFNGRYHAHLRSISSPTRPLARRSLASRTDEITPSSFGEHSHIFLTVKECLDGLELRTMIRYSGSNMQLNLTTITTNSFGVHLTLPCDHSPSTPLFQNLEKDEIGVVTTSVAAPLASAGRIAIVQTKGNPTAQFLACEPTRVLWMKECCLNCAVRQAKEDEKETTTVVVA